jgi:hypothetical protein
MGTYQVWIRLPGGGIEHTTLREDEWMTLQVDCAEADAAIEDAGWCGSCLDTASSCSPSTNQPCARMPRTT